MRKKIIKIMSMTTVLLCISTVTNIKVINRLSGMQIAFASTLSGNYTDSQGVNYVLYSDGTAEVKAGSYNGTSGTFPGSYVTGSTIRIPKSINNGGTEYKVTQIGEYAFYNRSSINNIIIDADIDDVGDCAFYSVENVNKVEFNGDTKILGYRMFEGCKSLETVKLTNSLVEIKNRAFYNCNSLEELDMINCKLETIGNDVFSYTKLKKIVIPEGVTSRVNFNNCSELVEIYLPDTVTGFTLSPLLGSNKVEIIKCSPQVASSNMALNYSVNLYNKDETEILASYRVKSGINFLTYANEVGKGWTKISGSPIANITANSEFKCDSVIGDKIKFNSPTITTNKVTAANREKGVTVTIN